MTNIFNGFDSFKFPCMICKKHYFYKDLSDVYVRGKGETEPIISGYYICRNCVENRQGKNNSIAFGFDDNKKDHIIIELD